MNAIAWFLIDELERIVNLSDSEMKDGDTARCIAKKAIELAKRKLMKFKYKGDALTCNYPIAGVTVRLSEDMAKSYGNENFICESVSESAARAIAQGILNSQPNLPSNCEFEVE